MASTQTFVIDSLESRQHLASTGAISGTLYYDVNANGRFDSLDRTLSGAGVYIDKNNNNRFDSGERRTTSASNGTYRFGTLGVGTFRIGVDIATSSGFRQTSPSAGTPPAEFASFKTQSVTLTAGQRVSARNFFLTGTGLISGSIRNITTNTGLARWGVYLDINGNNSRDSDETRYVTSSNGSFTIPNVPAGTWTVRQVKPSGWTLTSPSAGEFVASLVVTPIGAGNRVTGLSFLNRNNSVSAGANVRGFVFQDLSGDGIQNNGERALVGQFIRIRNLNREGVFEARTDSSGNYSFSNIPDGNWEVTIATSSLILTTTFPSSRSYQITVSGGGTFTGRNFGVRSVI